jgi:hypothetical protein
MQHRNRFTQSTVAHKQHRAPNKSDNSSSSVSDTSLLLKIEIGHDHEKVNNNTKHYKRRGRDGPRFGGVGGGVGVGGRRLGSWCSARWHCRLDVVVRRPCRLRLSAKTTIQQTFRRGRESHVPWRAVTAPTTCLSTPTAQHAAHSLERNIGQHDDACDLHRTAVAAARAFDFVSACLTITHTHATDQAGFVISS